MAVAIGQPAETVDSDWQADRLSIPSHGDIGNPLAAVSTKQVDEICKHPHGATNNDLHLPTDAVIVVGGNPSEDDVSLAATTSDDARPTASKPHDEPLSTQSSYKSRTGGGFSPPPAAGNDALSDHELSPPSTAMGEISQKIYTYFSNRFTSI